MIDRDIFIYVELRRNPAEQKFNSIIKRREIGDKIKLLNEYEGGIIVFDYTLGSSSNKHVNKFFMSGGHNNLDSLYPSQSYFDLPKGTIRKRSEKSVYSNSKGCRKQI